VLQCVAMCCSVVQCGAVRHASFVEGHAGRWLLLRCVVLRCVAVYCSVLHCFALCCTVLQCVAMCCTVVQCDAVRHDSFVEGHAERWPLLRCVLRKDM